jgi:enoyl-[acyl-carrier protein] reductase I
MYAIDLSGKTALVFGVGNKRSLAYGISQVLDQAGCRQAFSYGGERLRDNVEKLAADMEGSMTIECDVLNEGRMGEVFDEVAEKFGRIDYVVHSVAFAHKKDLEGEFSDTSRDGFRTALEVSAFSQLAMGRHAKRHMKAGGAMVNLSYLAAERAVHNYNVMGTAKAALEQITRQLALELGPLGIRINSISAGPVNTVSARGISGFQHILKVYEERTMLKRNITQEEVGKAALFLLSDLGSGVTGTTLHVDAGYSIAGL